MAPATQINLSLDALIGSLAANHERPLCLLLRGRRVHDFRDALGGALYLGLEARYLRNQQFNPAGAGRRDLAGGNQAENSGMAR